MDYSNGIQIPLGLLPSINEILRHELVIFFVHPEACSETVKEHRLKLTETLGDKVLVQQIKGQPKDLEAERRLIRNLREQAAGTNTPVFLYYHFARRWETIEYEADVTFYYYPGYGQVHLQRGKLRRPQSNTGSNVLCLSRTAESLTPNVRRFPHSSVVSVSRRRSRSDR